MFVLELEKNGFAVQRQAPKTIHYLDHLIASDLHLDLPVEDTILVELKTVKELLPVHIAQVMTLMKLLKKPQGLLFKLLHQHYFQDDEAVC